MNTANNKYRSLITGGHSFGRRVRITLIFLSVIGCCFQLTPDGRSQNANGNSKGNANGNSNGNANGNSSLEAALIAQAIADDAGGNPEQYAYYAANWASTLSKLSPAQLERVLTGN